MAVATGMARGGRGGVGGGRGRHGADGVGAEWRRWRRERSGAPWLSAAPTAAPSRAPSRLRASAPAPPLWPACRPVDHADDVPAHASGGRKTAGAFFVLGVHPPGLARARHRASWRVAMKDLRWSSGGSPEPRGSCSDDARPGRVPEIAPRAGERMPRTRARVRGGGCFRAAPSRPGRVPPGRPGLPGRPALMPPRARVV